MQLKKITKSRLARFFLGWFAYAYIQLSYKTSNWRIIYPKTPLNDIVVKSAIFAFWHGRLAAMPYLCPPTIAMNILISSHSDGEIIKNAMSHFGFKTISGSTKKKSTQALRHIIKKLTEGENIAITPDGSRGPRMQINSNILDIARITNKPIIPISFSSNKNYCFNSWDRFMLPMPFASGVLIYGEPIIVSKDASLDEIENLKQQLKSELNKITYEADILTNQQPILPE